MEYNVVHVNILRAKLNVYNNIVVRTIVGPIHNGQGDRLKHTKRVKILATLGELVYNVNGFSLTNLLVVGLRLLSYKILPLQHYLSLL